MYSEITTIVDVTEVTSDAELNINPILPGDFNGIGGLHLGDVNVPMVTPSDGGDPIPPDESGDDDTPTTTYVLSMKAGELMVAARSGGVLRRHDLHETDVDEAYAYVRLNAATYVPVVGYLFIFESGDEFHADTADDYPTSETLNDNVSSSGGGGSGGGGVLEVTVDWDTADGTLNKPWQEIADAPMAIFKENGYTYFCVSAKQVGEQYGVTFASVNTSSMAWDSRYLFVASSASGYPEFFIPDGGSEE